MDINSVTITGRLTADAEQRTTPNGTAVCSFSIANNRGFGDKKTTGFYNCLAWSKLAEIVGQYGKKGGQVAVSGELQQRSYETKDGSKRTVVEIKVNDFQLLGGKTESQATLPDMDEAF